MLASLKVLIIDDEHDLCFLLSRTLKKIMPNTLYAHTLTDGIKKFKEQTPDWLILDNNLPDGSGWEKANLFKELNDEIKIIFISANPDSKVSYKSGIYYHLIKPINVNEIKYIITEYH